MPSGFLKRTGFDRGKTARTFHDVTRQGPWGLVADMSLLVRPWGFRPDQIGTDVPIYLWHGKLDTVAPFSHARYLAKALRVPQHRFLVDELEGHVSLVYQRAQDVLRTL